MLTEQEREAIKTEADNLRDFAHECDSRFVREVLYLSADRLDRLTTTTPSAPEIKPGPGVAEVVAFFRDVPVEPSAPRQEEDNIEANRVIARAAIEIITECRDALGLQRSEQLTEFCKKVAEFNDQASWEEYDDHVAARSVAFAGDDNLRAEHHHTEMLALRAALLRSPSVLAAPLSQQPTFRAAIDAAMAAHQEAGARAQDAFAGREETDDD